MRKYVLPIILTLVAAFITVFMYGYTVNKAKIFAPEIVVTAEIETGIVTPVSTMSPQALTTTTQIPETTIEILAVPLSEAHQMEYNVYKPSTHYIHRSTCHWVDDTCYQIFSTSEVTARLCSECQPDIEIINPYEEIETQQLYYDNNDYQLLAEIVEHEAGSSWISTYNKAKVVAGVMNRVNDARFPSTVYDVLTQAGQFENYWPGCCYPSADSYSAVDYYFDNSWEFNSDNSWYGDGIQNHFYYQ